MAEEEKAALLETHQIQAAASQLLWLCALIKVPRALKSVTSCRRELLTCPVLLSFPIFSYKCLNLISHNLKFFQPLHWDYTAGLCSNSIIFIFFAYTVLCLVHFFFTTCILGAAMRYDFICNSPILGGKLNCPYESFKLSEFWFQLSLSNKEWERERLFQSRSRFQSSKAFIHYYDIRTWGHSNFISVLFGERKGIWKWLKVTLL